MHYVINIGWNTLVVPMNKNTAEAVSLLFDGKNVMAHGWDDGAYFTSCENSERIEITVISDQEYHRRIENGLRHIERIEAEKEAKQAAEALAA